ncbi:MAG: hypothetical protein J6A25_00530 [Lachnospiraceae bacterium]|nr:hypothetical protein [Lachnospiraceae bacterium]
MIFEFDQQPVFTQTLEIGDIGNTTIKCSSSMNGDWFLRTKTVMGKTSLIIFGPVIAGSVEDYPLIDGFAVSFSKFDYKERLIIKAINQLLNDPKKDITYAEEMLEQAAIANFPDIMNTYENFA